MKSLLEASSTKAVYLHVYWFSWLTSDSCFNIAGNEVVMFKQTHWQFFVDCSHNPTDTLDAELCTGRECEGIMFLPSQPLLLHILWPLPLPASDLHLFFFFAFLFRVLPTSQNILSLIPHLNTKFSWVCLFCLLLPASSSRQKWNTGISVTLKAGSGFQTCSLRSDGFQASPLGSANYGAFIS